MKRIIFSTCLAIAAATASAGTDGFAVVANGRAAQISIAEGEALVVGKAANLLADDVARVTGVRPEVVVTSKPAEGSIVVGTLGRNAYIDRLAAKRRLPAEEISGGWERFMVKAADGRLVIAGSDSRGTAYGTLTLSEQMGVSPWYWWADVPVSHSDEVYVNDDIVAASPTVKYRGIFINDEDWGLKPWASTNYERELGDIGPRTYARVCELLLRLKANMLAPAMHSCTGAFYSHPESKVVCDSFGIIITTSHCEPLLLNNAAESEWNQQRDGDWNYKTNRETIVRKWDNRLSEAAQYENIYTVAMRGVHDAGLRGNLPMSERVPLITNVIRDQRQLLETHIGRQADQIPQIFVPYKETMDIYEAGLKVPDDITLVWVDDNYGYMKRVSNPEEQKRSGRAGVYYHLSYLGAPHDYLWLNTTPTVLMYEELKKAYDHGADRYWLLNVGDIKPMELGLQTFMDMAWDFSGFDIDNVNRHQSELLARLFGRDDFQRLLDTYYRLAWTRKPEFMGYEREWDDAEHTGLHATDFSFADGTAQQRLADYEGISSTVENMAADIARTAPERVASFYEFVQFPIQAATQMNRKFLMAQLNQELARQAADDSNAALAQANWAAQQAIAANDSIEALNRRYNEQLDGKWRGMMTVPPGFCALYQNMPELITAEGIAPQPIADLKTLCTRKGKAVGVALGNYSRCSSDSRLVGGMGCDWQVLQLGRPTGKPDSSDEAFVEYALRIEPASASKITIELSTVPFWPIFEGRSNRIAVSVDGTGVQLFENRFKEYEPSWKDQVLVNAKTKTFTFAIDPMRKEHALRIQALDPGQMIQSISIR